MKKLRIFDIDGTILHPGCDLWYMTTRSLSIDIVSFDRYVSFWKKGIKDSSNPYQSSKSMMQKGIHLLRHGITGTEIRSESKHISINIIKNQKYFKGALQQINNSIKKGFLIIFSTTNYYEAGRGFLEAIREWGLIEKNDINSILISGSRIDWKTREIIHFNMGNNKIRDISATLNLGEQELIKNIDAFYCDDPEGNDSALLNYHIRGFIIRNKNNKNCSLPKNIILTDWKEILRDYT